MTAMELYAALDVSLETTAMCVVDRDGTIIFEAVVASNADALAARLSPYAARLSRIGLEAGPLACPRPQDASAQRHPDGDPAWLSAMIAKTDRNDARGMASLLRMGWFRPVHVKTMDAREQRALLATRSTLGRRLRDIENSVRGLLGGFGLRTPRLLRGRWDAAVRELIAGHPSLPNIIEPLLKARTARRDQLAIVDKRLRDVARRDPVCQRLMSVPGVGAIVALTFRAAVDQLERFRSSRSVGACFGLTPRRYQSGESERTGAISKAGDAAVRVALFEAAHVMMTRVLAWSSLKAWAMGIARRRAKRAKVALARKLAVILHRMWIDGTDFRFKSAPAETH
jgi:transposase